MEPSGSGVVRGNFFTRIAGGDPEILSRATSRDAAALTTHGLMLCTTALYSAVSLDLLAERIFFLSGGEHVAAAFGAAAVSAMVAKIDREVFCHGAYMATGIKALRQAGVKNLNTGTASAAIKEILATLIRCSLGLGFSGLYALAICLAVFSNEIKHDLDTRYRTSGAALVASVSERVDNRIKDASGAVLSEQIKVDGLTREQSGLRATIVDPVGGEARVAAAQADVQRLEELVQASHSAADAASTIETDETFGAKSSQTSGISGRGPLARAAYARAETAANRANALETELAAARQQLATLHTESLSSANTRRNNAQSQLGPVSEDLTAASQNLMELRMQAERLKQNRAADVQAELQAAPGFVQPDYGPIAQMEGLRRLAESDYSSAIFLAMIHLAGFAIEMGFLIARALGAQAYLYCALLASQTLIDLGSVADNFVERFNGGKREREDRESFPPEPEESDDIDNAANGGSVTELTPQGVADFFAPLKRPRGRPRKNPLDGVR